MDVQAQPVASERQCEQPYRRWYADPVRHLEHTGAMAERPDGRQRPCRQRDSGRPTPARGEHHGLYLHGPHRGQRWSRLPWKDRGSPGATGLTRGQVFGLRQGEHLAGRLWLQPRFRLEAYGDALHCFSRAQFQRHVFPRLGKPGRQARDHPEQRTGCAIRGGRTLVAHGSL